jgi:hypothetical protein
MDFKKLLQSKQVVTLLKQLWAMLGKKLGIKIPELPIAEEKPKTTKKASPIKRKPKKEMWD